MLFADFPKLPLTQGFLAPRNLMTALVLSDESSRGALCLRPILRNTKWKRVTWTKRNAVYADHATTFNVKERQSSISFIKDL